MSFRLREPGAGRAGFAMASTLLIVLMLAVIAMGAAWLASSERKTSHAESVHMRALLAADGGTEAAINFLRLSNDPPPILDFGTLNVQAVVGQAIQNTQRYDYDCDFLRKRPKPGWGIDYLDYEYAVTARGVAGQRGQSGVQAVVARLYREGY